MRYIKLNSSDKAKRDAIVDTLRGLVTQIYPNSTVDVYGSYETDLCLPQSDIDMVVFGTGMQMQEPNVAPLFELAEKIKASGLSDSMPTVISSAKVPLIKFQEAKTGVMVDVSFEVKSALETTELVKGYVKRYPMLKPLTLVVKYYLKQRYLNETWTGGIGSYTLVVMILSYLQMKTPSGGRHPKPGAGEDLSTLLLGFLQFYGAEFDYFENVISVIKGGSYLRKADKNWVSESAPEALSVEDPMNPSIDIAAGIYRIKDAKAVFLEGFWSLQDDSMTRRWPHTHSFLARLFDLGTSPHAVDHTRGQIRDHLAAATLHDPLPNVIMPNFDLLTLQDASALINASSAVPSSSPGSTSPRSPLALPAPVYSASASSSQPRAQSKPIPTSNHSPNCKHHNQHQQNHSGGRKGQSNKSTPSSPQKPDSRAEPAQNENGTQLATHLMAQSPTKPSMVAKKTPPTSPNKSAQNGSQGRRNQKPRSSPQQQAPQVGPRAIMLDPGAPDYQPLFPPLPTKSSPQSASPLEKSGISAMPGSTNSSATTAS